MASGNFSGSFDGSTSSYATPYIFWEYSQSIPNNNTKATATFKVKRERTGSTTNKAGAAWSITIDGSTTSGTINFKITDVSAGSYITIGSASKTINHNNDGTHGNITISASLNLSGTTLGTGSVSNSISLATIPRYAVITKFNITGKTSTSISAEWATDTYCDRIDYSLNDGDWINFSSDGTFTINNLTPNTDYSLKIAVRRQDSGLWTYSEAQSTKTYESTIPTITVSTKDVNSITVTSSCNVATSSVQYRIKENVTGATYSPYQDSGTFNNLNYNTSYDIQVKAVASESGEAGYATIYPVTYDIARITSAPNINFGDTATITKTNPSANVNRLRVETLNPTSTFATRNNVMLDNYTLILEDSEWDELYKKLGNNNSITIRFVIDTIVGADTYYDWVDKTCTLKGNQKTIKSNINGSWKRGKIWTNVNGTWKRAVIWTNVNGTWKRCI